ncbi:MAG: murein biosynthesis integral membrane protein MurJ [Synergistaceae bacterium]|nr:murein biosynthesis integral membrane protein MurJ [Synergistaceae bacterium]
MTAVEEQEKRPEEKGGEAPEKARETSGGLGGMVFHAMRMMMGTLVSRVLGLVREMLTAALFGATRQLDAFFVAYTLANLSRQLLAEGALSAAFVPVFSRTLSSDGRDSAKKLADEAMTILIFGCSCVVAVGVIFAPALVDIMAPGFAAEERGLAISLTRMMFPFLMLVSIGALAMGVLNSLGSFFIPAVAPAVSNLVYILFLLSTRRSLSVWNLAVAVLLGGLFHMLLQVYWCGRLKFALRPKMPGRGDPRLRNMMALFLPYAAGLSLNQLNPVISRMLGSFLKGGSISVLTYADRVLQLPLGLFVIAISQAVLPMLSRQDPDKTAEFRDFIRDAMRFNLFVILPVAAGLCIIASEMVHILFFRGAFTEWAWRATSTALSLYALGLPGMASSTVIMRAIYARRMPRAAVAITGVTVAVNLCASVVLMRGFAYAGLAAASAVAFTSASIFAAWKLSRNINEKLGIFELKWLWRVLLPLAAMSAALLAFKCLLPYPAASRLALRALWLAAAITGSAALYGLSTLALRCPEWRWIGDALKGRR